MNMKRTLIALVLATSVGLANATPLQAVSNMSTLVSVVGMFGERTWTIETLTEGRSTEDARVAGFRQAVEKVGTLVISNQQIQGDHMTRREMITFSEHNVKDFEILETSDMADGRVRLKMKVLVSEKPLKRREQASVGSVGGNFAGAQHLKDYNDTQRNNAIVRDSNGNRFKGANSLFDSRMNDYDKLALQVRPAPFVHNNAFGSIFASSSDAFTLAERDPGNGNRMRIAVGTEMRWNPGWISNLFEANKQARTGQGPELVVEQGYGSKMSGRGPHAMRLAQKVGNTQLAVRAKFSRGGHYMDVCWRLTPQILSNRLLTATDTQLTIHGGETLKREFWVQNHPWVTGRPMSDGEFMQRMSQFNHVDLKVVPVSECDARTLDQV